VSKAQRIFQKSCSLAVILYFAYFLFFIKVEKEIISIYKELWQYFWFIVKGNSASIIIFSLLVFFVLVAFINWILEKDEDNINVKKNVRKRKRRIEKKDKEKEKERIVFGQSQS